MTIENLRSDVDPQILRSGEWRRINQLARSPWSLPTLYVPTYYVTLEGRYFGPKTPNVTLQSTKLGLCAASHFSEATTHLGSLQAVGSLEPARFENRPFVSPRSRTFHPKQHLCFFLLVYLPSLGRHYVGVLQSPWHLRWADAPPHTSHMARITYLVC